MQHVHVGQSKGITWNMKTCSKCLTPKEETCFSKRAKSKDGLKNCCKDCDRLYSSSLDKNKLNTRKLKAFKERRNGIRVKILEYLKDKSCECCGEADPVVLEFDHINPSQKEFVISEAVGKVYGWDRIEAELKKCQILCANCHRRKTAKDLGWYKQQEVAQPGSALRLERRGRGIEAHLPDL